MHDEDGTYASSGTLKGRHLVVIAAVAVLAGTALYFIFFADRKPETGPTGPGTVTEVPNSSSTCCIVISFSRGLCTSWSEQ